MILFAGITKWRKVRAVYGATSHTVKSRVKSALLPQEGRIRFIPRKDYNPSKTILRGKNHGFLDKFGN